MVMRKSFGLVLAKIQEEDPSLVVERDPQTGETLLSGFGRTSFGGYIGKNPSESWY